MATNDARERTDPRAAALDVPEEVARTCYGPRNFIDPMLRAASGQAEGLDADTLRWMGYADQELSRLRAILDLPRCPGYAQGRPQYAEACQRCGGTGRDVILASNGGVGEVTRCSPCEGTGRRRR
jgi:hypothetical protein